MRKPANVLASEIQSTMGESWLPRIYRERVLKMRTRAYEFPSLRPNTKLHIHHTLLGIELKIGRRRMFCPDLPTARYLAVFARVGSMSVAIPYDITRISQIADELESAWHRMLLLADESTRAVTPAVRARVKRLLIEKVKNEFEAAGAGPRAPEFSQSTKQRG